MVARVLILSGSPGVGKSTVAPIIAADFTSSAVVRADDFFDYLASGFIAPWLPESDAQNIEVVKITTRAAAGYARAGWTTVLEGIIGPWFLDIATANATSAGRTGATPAATSSSWGARDSWRDA